MMLTAKRKLGWDRETAMGEDPGLRNSSKVFSGTTDQTSLQRRTTPNKQGSNHTELTALLRWEDDGGQTS